MIKIAVNAGHTASGAGSGAVGYLNESKETRAVVEKLIPLLEKKGYDVVNATVGRAATQSAYLKKAVQIANSSKADLFLSVHFNAGGGKGCEAYTWKGRAVKQAVDACKNLERLGFKNRGIKDGSQMYVIKKSRMKAVLLEVCFVDNKADADIYKRLGPAKIAQAIADGIGG